jgi:RNA polymerase sigma-70 factor (ECF subfamily)
MGLVDTYRRQMPAPSHAARDDPALIRAAQRGDGQAVEQLVDAHWHRAWRACMSVLLDSHRAEDLAQEAMVKAIAGLDSFDAGRSFGPWLERIAVNGCLDWLRRRPNQEQPVERIPESQSAELFTDIELASALQRLEPRDRAIVVMRHVLGYRVTEIAEMVGLSETAAGSRLHRAMGALRSAVKPTKETVR